MIRTNGTLGIIKFCFWGALLYIFLGSQNLIPLPAVLTDALIIAVILASSILDGWRLRFRRDKTLQFSIRHFIMPAVLILIYSCLNQLLRGLTFDYLKNSLTTEIRYIAYYLLGIVAVRAFGSRTVDYLLLMAVAAYVPAFAKHFQKYGLVGGITIMLNPEIFHIQTPLEIHTMTYILGFMALYYAYRWWVEKNAGAKWFFLISAILTVIGTKRIVLAAMFASVFMMLVLIRIKPEQRYSLMRLGCMILIVSSFAFLYLVHSGILERMTAALGVESSSRFLLWNLLRNKYDMSPLFMGYGISYGARIMHYVWQRAGLANAVALHNDILRVYLGLGFGGTILYWYNYFYATMRRARRIASIDVATFVFTIATYFFINSLTSNEGVNPMTNGMYFTILYTVVCYGNHNSTGREATE